MDSPLEKYMLWGLHAADDDLVDGSSVVGPAYDIDLDLVAVAVLQGLDIRDHLLVSVPVYRADDGIGQDNVKKVIGHACDIAYDSRLLGLLFMDAGPNLLWGRVGHRAGSGGGLQPYSRPHFR